MDLSKLSKEELQELQKQLEDGRVAAEQKKREDVEAYKELVGEAVNQAFEVLKVQSAMLSTVKSDVYRMFEGVKAMKADLFKTKENGQWSHTFTNPSGDKRITLGTNTLDNYDDTAEDGIAMVNEYLDSLSSESKSAEQAVNICRSLMARDRKGNLKPSKIVTLRKHAIESGNARFIEGVDIIMSAYKPVASKTYVRAEYKNDKGAWINVPLGMTEAEEDPKV